MLTTGMPNYTERFKLGNLGEGQTGLETDGMTVQTASVPPMPDKANAPADGKSMTALQWFDQKWAEFKSWCDRNGSVLMAAMVEVPRWTFTFTAIHEPMWVGAFLGALLSWSNKKGWDAYFASKSRIMLGINIFSLIDAIIVITPVLYAMTFGPIDTVNLSEILGPIYIFGVSLLWIWAVFLALTTFIPLATVSAANHFIKLAEKSVAAPAETVQDGLGDDLAPLPVPTAAAPVASAVDKPAAPSPSATLLGEDRQAAKAFWQGEYRSTHAVTTADKRTAEYAGKSEKTIYLWRTKDTAGDWKAGA